MKVGIDLRMIQDVIVTNLSNLIIDLIKDKSDDCKDLKVYILSNNKKNTKNFLGCENDLEGRGISVVYTAVELYRYLEMNNFNLFLTNDVIEYDLVKQGQKVKSILMKKLC